MARYTDMPSGMFPVQIFDVSDRVGWGLKNRIEDVQLVQYAINRLAPKLGLTDRRKSLGPGPAGALHPPLGPLTTDGRMGPETANAIASYQVDLNFRSGAMADNAIDPVYVLLPKLGGDPTGTRHITTTGQIGRRAIYNMNKDHVRVYGVIMNASDFPPALRTEIARAR